MKLVLHRPPLLERFRQVLISDVGPPPINPAYAAALGNRSAAYESKGDYEQAIAGYDQLVTIQPTVAEWWNYRCWARAVLGRLQPALADCNEALRLRPNDANTFDSRGLVHLKLAQFDKAIADYDAALKRNARLAGSLYGRGVAKQKKVTAPARKPTWRPPPPCSRISPRSS